MNVRVFCICIAALGALIPSAGAAPYWVSYEGNDYPENEGWERVTSHGGAIRSIEVGALVLDSREDVMINDYYTFSRSMNPSPGETFVMRWRMRVDDAPSFVPWDQTAGVFSDSYSAAAFEITEDRIRSVFEPGNEVAITPQEYHSYEFISHDMVSYELYIDGAHRLNGTFFSVFEASRVGWGDGVSGSCSLSAWDYYEFGVVPEPSNVFAIIAIVFVIVPKLRAIAN